MKYQSDSIALILYSSLILLVAFDSAGASSHLQALTSALCSKTQPDRSMVMTHDNSESQHKHYQLRPTFTPLPQNSDSRSLKTRTPELNSALSVVRAANEDDDLYDPYSDFHDGTLCAPEFEEDPWR